MSENRTILITGATGNVGRQVVGRLRKMGAQVRALVREPGAANLPDGVEVVRGDLTDPGSLRAAFDGVGTVFLLWPFLSADGAAAVVNLVAERARRVVYLSAMSVDDRAPEASGVWGQLERLIERSGVEWTFLRAGGFATNTLGWADSIRADGVVRWPYGGAARSLIHERDIADVATLALTDERHAGAKYVLTGPEVVTQAEQVRIIGEETGRPVRWEEISPEEARPMLLAALGDPDFVDGALGYWAGLVTEPEPVTRTVEEVTGAPARTFREWVRDHIDDFRRPTTAELANQYVSLFRKGKIEDVPRLMAAEVVRVAPMETAGDPVELRGIEAIMENSRRLNADLEIHGVEIDGPFVAGDRFAVRFAFDETHTPTGKRGTTAKMSLYTVAGGKIAREEVYYFNPPTG